MTDTRAQSTYQVRLGWGEDGLTELTPGDIIVVIDAIDSGAGAADLLAKQAAGQSHSPTVFLGSLRNATATAQAVVDEQFARGGRTSINLVLVGDRGRFAVEDYLAAGAIADALTTLGLDHSAPDVAVATEGFRPLTRAVKHLFAASAAGLALKAEGRGVEAKTAAEHDAEGEAQRFSA